MFSLLKKELNTFFGSITGYLVISIFLITTSLFLWIIPGSFNIIDQQRSSLKGFFELAPWLYLFLIPAITMKMFAEEKRMGTIEMIVTRPISSMGIVMAKYLASLILVVISLIPTLLYFYSVYKLGNPVGNIDTGATWGSFIGLLFLASVYISIGLFASILSNNQAISFLIAIASSYIMFLGLDFAASSGLSIELQNLFVKLGINEHYISISRGIIDSRDLVYFISTTFFFLYLTRLLIRSNRITKIFKFKALIPFLIFLIISGWFISRRFFRVDLTAEKRYSLSTATKNLLKEQNQQIVFKLYLSGNLPAGMKEFQESIIEKIEDFNAYSSSLISYRVIDIYKITPEKERQSIINNLIKSGIQPVNFGHKTTEGLSTKQIFPGVIVQNSQNAIALNLLNNNPMLSADENLQQSIELLEYKFARAIRVFNQNEKPVIAFLSGHNEANQYETADIKYTLSENYKVIDCVTNDLLKNDSISTLIIASPTSPFTEKDKFYIDQFVMKGGKVLWCVDPVFVSIDSLSKGHSTLAFEKDLNIRDLLFKYGIRINSDLLQDAVCLEYPVNTAPVGQQAKFTPAPFYYAPLALPNPNHIISRNLNNVQLEFTSSIDLVGKENKNKSSIILATSPYGRKIKTPVEVSLMSATNPPDKKLFNKPNIPIGALIEGVFESAFKNRITSEYGIGPISDQSEPTKIIVITDGNIIKNKVRNQNGNLQVQALGYDQYSGQTFGNSEFLVNCINYLSDDIGLMQLRSKVIKLRMLDKVKIRSEKIKWQILNTLFPLLFFLFFGLIFNFIRHKKYTS